MLIDFSKSVSLEEKHLKLQRAKEGRIKEYFKKLTVDVAQATSEVPGM